MPDGSTLHIEKVRTGRRRLAMEAMRKYPATVHASSILRTLHHIRPERLRGGRLIVVDNPVKAQAAPGGPVKGPQASLYSRSAMRGLPLFSRQADVANNIPRGQAAMDRVIRNRGDEMEAMERGGLGKIAFLWGNAGRLDARKGPLCRRQRRRAHHCPAQSGRKRRRATARAMPDVIALGDVDPVYGPPGGKRVQDRQDSGAVSISLWTRAGVVAHGWEEGPGDAEGVNPNDTYAPTSSGIRAEEAAGPELTIEPAGGPVKGPKRRSTSGAPISRPPKAAARLSIASARRCAPAATVGKPSRARCSRTGGRRGSGSSRAGSSSISARQSATRRLRSSRAGADRNRFDEEAHEVAEVAAAYVKRHKKEADTLFDIMHAATLAGVDPALDYRPSILRPEAFAAIRSLEARMRGRPGRGRSAPGAD